MVLTRAEKLPAGTEPQQRLVLVGQEEVWLMLLLALVLQVGREG
jgi:hypothetical protein